MIDRIHNLNKNLIRFETEVRDLGWRKRRLNFGIVRKELMSDLRHDDRLEKLKDGWMLMAKTYFDCLFELRRV
jgi:hypothetical protein